MKNKKGAAAYIDLREKIDKLVSNIEKIHTSNINCKKGCDTCCVNLTVFPVEMAGILYEMELDGFDTANIVFDNSATCGFLKNNLCQIYKYRPVICRTHGLPITFLNDDDPCDPFNEISFCELNFVVPEETLEDLFDETNLLDIDEINRALFKLNKDSGHGIFERIPLKDILEKN